MLGSRLKSNKIELDPPFEFHWDITDIEWKEPTSNLVFASYSDPFKYHDGYWQLQLGTGKSGLTCILVPFPSEEEVGFGTWDRGLFRYQLSITTTPKTNKFHCDTRHHFLSGHRAVHRNILPLKKVDAFEVDLSLQWLGPVPVKISPNRPLHVGLVNQGATCYLNSLIQALYHIPQFRRMIFNAPTSATVEETRGNNGANLLLAMQRLFFAMRHDAGPVSTSGLTKAFGWSEEDGFVQHDVSELLHILFDRIETAVPDDGLKKMFALKTKHVIDCVNVPYRSEVEDSTLALNLNVSESSSVQESIKSYLKTENLVGDNQYFTTEHGYQDAVRREELVALPPVLTLSLARFTYDTTTGAPHKLTTKLEFPLRLSLGKWATDQPADYTLNTVLVHSGTARGGHYFAYICLHGRWYRFDDEAVMPVQEETVFAHGFGSGSSKKGRDVKSGVLDTVLRPLKRLKGESSTAVPTGKVVPCAYMLQYMREDCLDTLLDPKIDQGVLTRLKQYIDRIEHERDSRKALERVFKQRQRLRLVTDAVLRSRGHAYTFPDVLDGPLPEVTAQQTDCLALHLEAIKQAADIPADSPVALHRLIVRRNGTIRPAMAMAAEGMNTPMKVARHWSCDATDGALVVVPNPGKGALVVIKAYYGKEDTIRYLTTEYLATNRPFETNFARWAGLLGVDPDTPLAVYEEVESWREAKLRPSTATPKSVRVTDGDILIVAVDEDVHTLVDHMTLLAQKMRVWINPVCEEDEGGVDAGMGVIIDRNTTVRAIHEIVCDLVDIEPIKVELFLRGDFKSPLDFKADSDTTLGTFASGGDPIFKIGYRRMPFSQLEMMTTENTHVLMKGKVRTIHTPLEPTTRHLLHATLLSRRSSSAKPSGSLDSSSSGSSTQDLPLLTPPFSDEPTTGFVLGLQCQQKVITPITTDEPVSAVIDRFAAAGGHRMFWRVDKVKRVLGEVEGSSDGRHLFYIHSAIQGDNITVTDDVTLLNIAPNVPVSDVLDAVREVKKLGTTSHLIVCDTTAKTFVDLSPTLKMSRVFNKLGRASLLAVTVPRPVEQLSIGRDD
ncbi:Ubiquitin carboxyl-terminal hydrolase [Carpediemonas membranifera]|uniref:Ubiquitin carboxyl-terminal hydrolase n=1 Tax=Carpediemonas membranifera TaxID=201153 RepID=A0A8J6AXV8_9EUKA|nr:Ubiquitin carboxyl-terminal hydrolase [Carpediemonas membranifera]|eukprot:KAG9389929.1 Ubiquitin carboxyl-terminal hydrolase [Carpediemonas membranifera]